MPPPLVAVVAVPSDKRVAAVGLAQLGEQRARRHDMLGYIHMSLASTLIILCCFSQEELPLFLPPACLPLQLRDTVCITFRSTSVVLSLGKDAAVAFPLREKDIKWTFKYLSHQTPEETLSRLKPGKTFKGSLLNHQVFFYPQVLPKMTSHIVNEIDNILGNKPYSKKDYRS